ncbi:HU family DNA-binding protein [Microbacterium sp. SL62]|uniref:HU family DNA-binding protein n=1 Tax=Microbacterium sp. SL62 TaxID=2995139 RepID=UPI002276F0FA|nr:HU family DNA-binding protein [Microbacterium sp. SL62]MCY1718509.1 HU family DNA-binding protein [Microbacterium sp. SL62]
MSAAIEEASEAKQRSNRKSDAERISKREFVMRVGRRAGVPLKITNQVYDAIFDEIKELAGRGVSVTLTGFGKFYPQVHKGHQVRFKKEDDEVRDYAVLKFSATRETNQGLGIPSVSPDAEKRS